MSAEGAQSQTEHEQHDPRLPTMLDGEIPSCLPWEVWCSEDIPVLGKGSFNWCFPTKAYVQRALLLSRIAETFRDGAATACLGNLFQEKPKVRAQTEAKFRAGTEWLEAPTAASHSCCKNHQCYCVAPAIILSNQLWKKN